jgi:3-oxoacyl-[acyl-carrier protein] reductase
VVPGVDLPRSVASTARTIHDFDPIGSAARQEASLELPVIAVTGAASGLGQGLVGRLVSLGHRVIAADCDNHNLEEAARLRAWPLDSVRLFPLDVREPAQWSALFAMAGRAFGGVDVLLHAAGHRKEGVACSTCPEDVHRHLDVNAKGTAFALQAAAAHMVPRGHGHVVVFSSLDAFAPRPGLGLAGAAAAAARSVARAADLELRPRGVAVTVVCTAAVGTDVSAEVVVDAVFSRALASRPRELALPQAQGLTARLASVSSGLCAFLWARRQRRAEGRQAAPVRPHEA